MAHVLPSLSRGRVQPAATGASHSSGVTDKYIKD
jgi:hypothetical protein